MGFNSGSKGLNSVQFILMKPLTLLHTIAFLGIFYKVKKECLSLRRHPSAPSFGHIYHCDLVSMIKPFARFSLKMLEEVCTEFVKKASVSQKSTQWQSNITWGVNEFIPTIYTFCDRYGWNLVWKNLMWCHLVGFSFVRLTGVRDIFYFRA